MSLAIEVSKVAVHLHVKGGRKIDGFVFVHSVRAHDLRPETVAGRLNEAGAGFLPVQVAASSGGDAGGRAGETASPEVVLVRVESIAWLELDEAPPEAFSLAEVGGSRQSVELLMSTGDRLTGELLYQARESQKRVLDLLNARGDRFLLLESEGRFVLVQRDAIDQVKG